MKQQVKSRPLGVLHLLRAVATTAVIANAATHSDFAGHAPNHVPQHHVSSNGTFEPLEATIDGLHQALFSGQTTCRHVVSSHISRIEVINPIVNSLITLDPTCLQVADRIDAQLAGTQISGMSSQQLSLLCVPVILKDNYDAPPTVTTGGCAGLASREPPQADAPTVRALREAGAVILGKANLQELALEGLSVSSLGGQTLNPYDLTRTPGGSSGGTGAALAASLAMLGTGTDTVNSLRSPASANSLVSVRPTRGLISRSGIIPVSYTQDAAGPMARNVRDLARMLTVMAGVGEDPDDNATVLVPPEARKRDYLEDLLRSGQGGGTLEGLRLGAVDGFWNHMDSAETTPVNTAMEDMMAYLRSQGAKIVNVTNRVYDATAILNQLDVQRFEYREVLTEYLGNGDRGAPESFHELYYGGSDDNFLVIHNQYEYVNTAAVSSTSNTTYAEVQKGIQALKESVLSTFSEHNLDALIYPEQKNLVVKVGSASQSGRNGILAALTGNPVVTVPAGFSDPSDEAPVGVPIGMEILGLPFSEGRLLHIAERITKGRPVRRIPATAKESIKSREYHHVPEIRPDVVGIPEAYPVGTLSSS